MKKFFLVLVVALMSVTMSAQETEFSFNKEGFTDYIVTECEGKTQAELYKKTLDWISITYKNPKEVIKAKIENDYIRIEGSSTDLVCFNILGKKSCNRSRYTIEIFFKDSKYKFDIINNIEYLHEGGWAEVSLDKTNLYYNKKNEIRNNYKYFPEIATYFNILNKGLNNFVIGNEIPSKKSDW